MALAKCGNGVTDIRGKFAGNVFTRDKSGLHIQAQKRAIRSKSPGQRNQRNAFKQVRRWTTDPRWVSYYIYFVLNGLPLPLICTVTGNPTPNVNGLYYYGGDYWEKYYFVRDDEVYYIWWYVPTGWIITTEVADPRVPLFTRNKANIEGPYTNTVHSTGSIVVDLSLAPPPPDYKIPKL